jgi:hypothetical protein
MTFAEYITSCHVTDTPRGDFIEDARVLIRVGKLPDVQRWSQLEWFLLKRGACREAIEEGRKLWRQYERKQIDALM